MYLWTAYVRLLMLHSRRMLQFNQGKKTKRVVELRKKAEKTFIEQLDLTIEKIYTKEHLNEYTNNQGK